MLFDTLTIVGVGLIGGSIGLAARQREVARRVIGIGRNENTLRAACDLGCIDSYTVEMSIAIAESDLIVFCTPVDRIAEQIVQASEYCKPGAIITDAGSTKADIVEQLKGTLPEDIHFVGSHPLAGSEKRGPENSNANLFDGRLTIITPTKETDPQALQKVTDFWEALGSEVSFLDPKTHDRVLGMTSHLPHLVAAALSGILPNEWHPYTATGFRDTTRIAAGDPHLWAAIFLHNRDALCESMVTLTNQMATFLDAIVQLDEKRLVDLLTQAKQVRDALGS